MTDIDVTLLRKFLDQNPLPWLRWDESKQKFIMVVDNHLLSTYRNCPQHYVNRHIQGIRRKAVKTEHAERIWFLEFGICLHEMLELYYKNFRKPDFDMLEFATKVASKLWVAREMGEFAEEKEYKALGGLIGFTGLLVQYATILSPQNEHLRVLATEVSFGKNLEVKLGSSLMGFCDFYLSGRIDLLVDDGYFICPLDHKTKACFKGELLDHLTDEGPTGYIYALKQILPSLVPEDMILKRDCSKILMNYISKATTTDPSARFKRIVIRKTEWELEQYRHRMISTCNKLFEDVLAYVLEFPVDRNTMACMNWMRRQCTYFDICRQQSAQGVEATINNGFIKAPLWDTEAVAPTGAGE